jgi:hypothetical protein
MLEPGLDLGPELVVPLPVLEPADENEVRDASLGWMALLVFQEGIEGVEATAEEESDPVPSDGLVAAVDADTDVLRVVEPVAIEHEQVLACTVKVRRDRRALDDQVFTHDRRRQETSGEKSVSSRRDLFR